MGKLSYQYLFSRGVKDLEILAAPFLPDTIAFNGIANDIITDQDRGEAILELYFSQILSGQKVFLDLRPARFNLVNKKMKWIPNGLYCQFDHVFHQGLINLYSGFYQQNDELYEKGLNELGLISNDDNADQRDEIKNIFSDHFGANDQTKVKFEMNHFVHSFHLIFDRIFHQQKKLSEDFVYLGIYLVTLYLHLGPLETQLDVRKSFFRAHDRIIKNKS